MKPDVSKHREQDKEDERRADGIRHAAEIENHKLDDWEDRELVAGALAFVMQSSKKIQGDAKARQTIFERICRLDAVQALSV